MYKYLRMIYRAYHEVVPAPVVKNWPVEGRRADNFGRIYTRWKTTIYFKRFISFLEKGRRLLLVAM